MRKKLVMLFSGAALSLLPVAATPAGAARPCVSGFVFSTTFNQCVPIDVGSVLCVGAAIPPAVGVNVCVVPSP